MIHLLEVHPGLSQKELKKLSRRYAMTGGYELTLAANLNAADLEQLFKQFSPEIDKYQMVNSECKASNAYRILALVRSHQSADTQLKLLIDQCLRK